MIRRATYGVAMFGIVALITTLSALTAVQSAATDLLKPLNLSGYPSSMQPPDFKGSTTEGQMVSLSRLRGKVVLLNFWATWCEECRPEMPLFERLHRDFASQGLAVLGINAREETTAVRAYAKELSLTFPLVLDPKGEINAAYGVIGLPTTFLIGRDGRAVALAVGSRDWSSAAAKAIVKTLLAEKK